MSKEAAASIPIQQSFFASLKKLNETILSKGTRELKTKNMFTDIQVPEGLYLPGYNKYNKKRMLSVLIQQRN